MKKYIGMIALGFLIILSGCSQTETDERGCKNTVAVEQAEKLLVEDKKQVYCEIDTDKHLGEATMFVKENYDAERITQFLELPYYNEENTKRYIAYDDKKSKVEDIVTKVNIGLDQPYFTDVDIIKDLDDDLMLINKYHRLPDDYTPDNLVETPSACVIGEDYSCQTEKQYLKKNVADAFAKLVEAGKTKGIQIKAIASYRSFSYQQTLYNYYANSEGKEYADKYYARPGQSEHNSALTVDVTLNDANFNEIEITKDYPWLLENMANYGFILRYPEDKVDITGYQYESWHLRYVGEKVAQEITKQGITFDEYIARKEI